MFDILAKTTLVLHLFFIIFVIFGSFFIFIKFKFIFLHLPSLFWGIYIEFSQSICPLTYLEKQVHHFIQEGLWSIIFII